MNEDEGFKKFFYVYRDNDTGGYGPASRKMVRDLAIAIKNELNDMEKRILKEVDGG